MNPMIRNFARRLIAHEAAESQRSLAGKPVPFCAVYEKLREPLARFAGHIGLLPLLHRALTRSKETFPWLGELQIESDGFMERPAATAQRDQKEIANGEAAFLSNLLGLLVTFLGAGVTLHLVQDVWPQASIDDLDPRIGDTNKGKK